MRKCRSRCAQSRPPRTVPNPPSKLPRRPQSPHSRRSSRICNRALPPNPARVHPRSCVHRHRRRLLRPSRPFQRSSYPLRRSPPFPSPHPRRPLPRLHRRPRRPLRLRLQQQPPHRLQLRRPRTLPPSHLRRRRTSRQRRPPSQPTHRRRRRRSPSVLRPCRRPARPRRRRRTSRQLPLRLLRAPLRRRRPNLRPASPLLGGDRPITILRCSVVCSTMSRRTVPFPWLRNPRLFHHRQKPLQPHARPLGPPRNPRHPTPVQLPTIRRPPTAAHACSSPPTSASVTGFLCAARDRG